MNSNLGLHPEIGTIRSLIDQRADLWSDKIFLISPETQRSVTFQELRRRAIELGRRLSGLGLAKGDKVAFLLDNGVFTAELSLASMYAGFVPVPVNVVAGPSQIESVIRNSAPKLVFVSEEYAALLQTVLQKTGQSVEVISSHPEEGVIWPRTENSCVPLPAIQEEDEGLLIYTSGSTGQPKGALFNHRNIMAIGARNLHAHQLSPHDRFLCVLPLYHMNAQETLVSTLFSGGTVVMPRRFSVNSYWSWLSEYRCTWSAIVPTIIKQLLHSTDPYADDGGAGLEQLRFLRTSASSIPASLHSAFEEKFRLLLIEVMGVTEAGGVFLYTPLPPNKRKIGSPGIPHGFEVNVVNTDNCVVRSGEIGEIVLRGPSVLQGYYKDPKTTSEVMTPEGWFRTGDLAYKDDEGYFFISGRAKEIIIKGGENIAPKEIDEALAQHPSVLEVAALGIPDSYWGEDIVAYVVLKSAAQCNARELLSFCERQIGRFKTPSRIYFVDDLPKGPSRKIQRLQLVEDAQKRSRCDNNRTQVATAVGEAQPRIEERLTALWSQVLKQDRVGLHDNFFDLGASSLHLVEAHSKIQEIFQKDIPIVEMFEHPTISALAQHLRQKESGQVPIQQSGGPVEKLDAGRNRLKQLSQRRQRTGDATDVPRE
jgi:acyl-CoA synthetase (AMP-forming)/AMP-acid ligase II/acyl carrier protein